MIATVNTQKIFLASQSPRRKELLEQIGLQPCVIKVDVPEQNNNESPGDYVKRLAQDKALAGWHACKEQYGNADIAPVIGADTIVVLGGRILEKPENLDHAHVMLLSLADNTHSVITAVAVCHSGEVTVISVKTQVRFRAIGHDEALRYVQTGEPMDKAGGYGIQGLAAVFVSHVEGSYSNVVGLPLYETSALLSRLNVSGF